MDIRRRIINMVVFSLLFLFVGTTVPTIFNRHIPSGFYYSVDSEARTNQLSYSPCEIMRISFVRTSRSSYDAKLRSELIRVYLDEKGFEVHKPEFQYESNSVLLGKGVQLVEVPVNIPCDVPDGEYYLRRTLIFYPEQYKKEYKYITNRFFIKGGEIE